MSTIHLLVFLCLEIERLPSVQTTVYPLNMINPLLPYLLLLVTSSDREIQNPAASILHSVTSVLLGDYLPAMCSIDRNAIQADIDLPASNNRNVFSHPQIDVSAASTLIGQLSTLFADPTFSSPGVDTVKILIRIVSSLLSSATVLKHIANCLPLTLLVMALTAAPPSHHLHILTIYLEFSTNCRTSKDHFEPLLKRLIAIFPPDTASGDPLVQPLSKLLTNLASLPIVCDILSACLSDSVPPSRLILSLLTIIDAGKKEKSPLTIRLRNVPRIATLLLQDLDELELSFLLSVLGQNADESTGFRFEEDEAHQIVKRLLDIEQRHPLQPHTQDTNKTTTGGTTLPPRIDRNGEADASTGAETSVEQLVDVWRVMRMVVSSLTSSPSRLEGLHVLYPLIFERLKERGASLFRKDEKAERTRERLLAALVRVCSELVPLLASLDCFPLVRLVSFFISPVLHLANVCAQPVSRHRPQRYGTSGTVTLPDSYTRLREFFLRVDVVTQGLDMYITHHDIFFTPLSAKNVSAGVDCVVPCPVPLLQFFVDFEVKWLGVKEAALLQQNNNTVPDQTRRQLLLHLLTTMKKTNELDPEAVCDVLKSFRGLPPGTGQLIDTLKDTLTITRNDAYQYLDSPEFNTSLPVCSDETCRLMCVLLTRATPNEADSEERWRVVLREEGWEDLLNVILKQRLAKLGRKSGMNCLVPSLLFAPSTIQPAAREGAYFLPPGRFW
ncbi:hypothetical protein BLNAU_21797 [Blattamonas nauphoetae]|uniref:Uncharacterized protein n=1 Tax=Blattamonas nauphoetae TaxID=2049346 RepID=A0ABQ9WVA9_9EUKA|nr:hypothetical protein BLNAU_21797 [Blattamonas nauphoetae]